MRFFYRYGNLLIYGILLTLGIGSEFQAKAAESDVAWDKALANMVCENVDIQADLLTRAWQEVASSLLLRCNLLIRSDFSSEGKFRFKSPRCTGKQILDALVAAYPQYIWGQDEESGVIWIYPKNLKLQEVLPQKVRLVQNYEGLRMQQDVLEPLNKNPLFGVGVKEWGPSFYDTLNCPVNLASGIYSMRRLLNCCCLASPRIGFFVTLTEQSPMPYVVAAINLKWDRTKITTPGARLWWQLVVKKQIKGPTPSLTEVGEALADANSEVRKAAQKYVDAVSDAWKEEIVNSSARGRVGLWVAVEVIGVLCRSNEVICPFGVNRIRQILAEQPDLLTKGDYGMALLAALELLRLEKDDSAFQIVSKRPVKTEELQPVMADIARVVRLVKETDQWPKIQDWLSTLPTLKQQVTSPRLFEAVVEK